jgi:hypothetical protein
MPLVVGLSLEKYWTKFELRESDLDFIYNLLLDREAPLTTVEMVSALINFRIERLQEEAQKEASDDNLTYRPGDEYQVGNQLVFPDLNMLKGTITDIRPGENPDIGSFDVIEVRDWKTVLNRQKILFKSLGDGFPERYWPILLKGILIWLKPCLM